VEFVEVCDLLVYVIVKEIVKEINCTIYWNY